MKAAPSILVTVVAASLALQAHAVMPSDSLVNRINTLRGNSLGGGGTPSLGGGGGTIGGICTGSPENPTIVLALLTGVGLMLGRRLTGSRNARLSSPQSS